MTLLKAPKVSRKYLEALKAPRATITVLGTESYGSEKPVVTFLRARLMQRTGLRDKGLWCSVRSEDPLVQDGDGDDLFRGILDLEGCDLDLVFFPNIRITGYSDEGVKIRTCSEERWDPLCLLDPFTGALLEGEDTWGEDRYLIDPGRYLKYRVDFLYNPRDK